MQLFIKVILLTIMLVASSAFAADEKKYYDNGTIQFEYSYRSGQLHGLTKEFYETGELKGEHEYRAGKLVNKRNFRRNGDLEYELKYEDGQKIEYKIEYHPTGERFRQRTLINGKREGLEIEFHRNGKKKAERNYIADKKEGSAKGYYINGRLQGDWLFENGEPVSATIFYSTGEKWLVHSDFDSKGRLNGSSKEYEKDGNLKAIRYYKDNDMEQRRRVSRWLRWWWAIW